MIIKILRFMFIAYLNIIKKSKISYLALVNRKTLLEGFNTIHNGAVLSGTHLGYATFIGQNSFLPNSKIGRYCSIADSVTVITHTHPSSVFVSTHPSFYSLLKQSGFTYASSQKFNEELTLSHDNLYYTEIGHDVWIGSRAMIMGGTKIGHGSIIAAGAVVTKDVEPYSIVGGVPAKQIRMRFTDEEIKYLLETRWWEKDKEWISRNSEYFLNINLMRKLDINIS